MIHDREGHFTREAIALDRASRHSVAEGAHPLDPIAREMGLNK